MNKINRFILLLLLILFSACSIVKQHKKKGFHLVWNNVESSKYPESKTTLTKSELSAEKEQTSTKVDTLLNSSNEIKTEETKQRQPVADVMISKDVQLRTIIVRVQQLHPEIKESKALSVLKIKQKQELDRQSKKAYNGLLSPEEYLLRSLYLFIAAVVLLTFGLLVILVYDTGDVLAYIAYFCVVFGAISLALCIGNLFLALLAVIFG
jgi:hypothetical protein